MIDPVEITGKFSIGTSVPFRLSPLGAHYYRITHPGHNLERARNQLHLVKLLAGAG